MREAVLAAIRNALRDVGRAHPEAGRHLQRSLVTGVLCVYQPEGATPWQIETH
jgi:hypothetical protein